MQTDYERQDIFSANGRLASAASGEPSELQSLLSMQGPEEPKCTREERRQDRAGIVVVLVKLLRQETSASACRHLNHPIPYIWDPRGLKVFLIGV